MCGVCGMPMHGTVKCMPALKALLARSEARVVALEGILRERDAAADKEREERRAYQAKVMREWRARKREGS